MLSRVDTTIVGVIVGVLVGVAVAIGVFFLIRYYKRSSSLERQISNNSTIPIRINGENSVNVDSSVAFSDDLEIGDKNQNQNLKLFWGGKGKRSRDVGKPLSVSGIPRYHYK
jgi:MFS superfamily sulfate permease-like transporter